MSKQQLAEIVTPHDHDVLSGRGNFVNYHSGNEHFRALVRKHKVAYVACPKPQKGKFSKMIVDEIRSRNPPGRFLKQDPTTKLWYEIGDKKALDKTRQALREGAPEIMKGLSGDQQDDGSGAEEPEPTSPNSAEQTTEQAPSPPIGQNNNIVAYPPTSAGIDGSNQFHDTYSPVATAPVSMLNEAPGSTATVFAHNGIPLSHMPQSNRSIRTVRMMQAAQAMAGAQNVNPVVNPTISHPGMPMQQSSIPERGFGRHVSAPSGLSLQGPGNNFNANIHNVDHLHPASMSNLPVYQSSNNEFEPRPIDPALNNKFQQTTTSQYNDYSRCCEPERVAPLPPRKAPMKGSTEGRPKGMEREGSEKSLKVDNIFNSGTKKYQDHQGSSAHLSIMSLSIGDMQTSLPEHAPATDSTDPDDLAPLFNTSLRVGGRRDATSRLSSSVSTGFHSSLGHVMDMSVATLGDRLSDFGEASIQRLTESTADMSFSNVFEEKERDMYVNNQR